MHTLNDYIATEDFAICAITETWFCDDDKQLCCELTPSGFDMLHKARSNKKGGGVAFVYRSSLKPKEIETLIFESFEHLAVSFTMDNKQINRCCDI